MYYPFRRFLLLQECLAEEKQQEHRPYILPRLLDLSGLAVAAAIVVVVSVVAIPRAAVLTVVVLLRYHAHRIVRTDMSPALTVLLHKAVATLILDKNQWIIQIAALIQHLSFHRETKTWCFAICNHTCEEFLVQK